MSPESKPAPALQFDKAIPTSTQSADVAPAEGATCGSCQQTIANDYYEANGHAVCRRCREEIARQAETPTGLGVLARATLYGLGAAILGAILYYAVIAITDYEIGLVAIAIGYMVGYAIRTAAGNRGGLRFQILAVVLTYWAVGLAYTPFVFQESGQAEEAQVSPASTEQASTEQASTEPASTEALSTDPASAEAEPPAADEPLGPAGAAIGFGLLLVLSLTLPVLSVIGSMPSGAISAAIIAFGMHQAWRMTGAPHVVISGPYRIAHKRSA